MLQQTVKKSVSEQDCTHLLFSGPLDSGKKTLIMALLRQLSASSSEKGLIASYLSCIGLKWPPTSARIGNVIVQALAILFGCFVIIAMHQDHLSSLTVTILIESR
ncbi:uncharacterized protein LOC115694323 isoform X4 [Syzygium oleosum]|uniref:uncharacterized protein LOC115694323 isoform X4 n=1 Tax=Syzygium oleosum TaxID=219896 RepID=UPI0011D23DA5|nr:uncharacterized protein LOC115694323 isoform X4 [Syzygium oleosum]